LFERSGCLTLLGRALLVGGIGYLLTMAVCWRVTWTLREVLPPDALLVGMICVALPLWPLLSLAACAVLFEFPRMRREAALREAFLRRDPATDEAFGGLLPPVPTAAVRAELRRFIGRPEVADRLLPSDPIRGTCELVGICPDDLEWDNFLRSLESQLGIRLPEEAFPNRLFPDTTVAELLGWCARSEPTRALPGT
jgi:hypothetical protein